MANDISDLILNSDTVTITPQLLGHYLRVNTNAHGWQDFEIVEVEAYTQGDPACHAYQIKPGKKPTPRAANLYKPPGTAYVYMIYGMYYCLNVVTDPEGVGGAVLFRGVIAEGDNHPFSGQNLIGPGRLCRQLGLITELHNGLNMLSPQSPVQLVASNSPTPDEYITATPRIGITKGADLLRRYIDTRYLKK